MASKSFDAFPGFLFGADPELFILDPNGNPVCADGMIPGTKHEPFKVEYGAVQVDGMAAEFNIDPVSNYADFSRNIRAVVRQLEGMLPNGYRLAALSSVVFPHEVFKNAPPRALELGCMPDFNAWTGAKNPPPGKNLRNNPMLRTAAGHIHIGWQGNEEQITPEHIGHCNDLVKQLDWYLGVWSLDKDKDGGPRRQLYGKAGACRYKPYGVEYRVLSNFWVLDNDLRKQVWNRVQRALFDMQDHFLPQLMSSYNERVCKSIDNTGVIDDVLEVTFQYPVHTMDRRHSIFG